MIAGFTYYELLQYFVIYSFLGWCVEVIYQAVAKGVVVNRGFLNGPVCPIYGFGVISVFALMSSLPDQNMYEANGLVTYVAGVLLATAIELFGGWALDKIFHARWWDYSNKPFNFHGYICLEFSLIWGLGILLIVKIIQPAIGSASARVMPETQAGWILTGIVYAAYASDFAISVMIMVGLNKKMAELDEMRRRMRVVSNGLSRRLGEGALETAQHVEEAQVQAALARAEIKQNVAETTKEIRNNVAETSKEIKNSVAETSKEIKSSVAETSREIKGSISGSINEREQRLKDMKAEYNRKMAELTGNVRSSQFFGAGRLLNAFPQMEHRQYNDILKRIRGIAEENEDEQQGEENDLYES